MLTRDDQGALPQTGRILLAVSGGGDSMAMLHMAGDGRCAGRLHVATVDHGLRAGSADEARMVAQAAASRGLTHTTLVWRRAGTRPTQAAAREARYALLVDEARRVGASAIALAHTCDDQAETVLMRALRIGASSGTRGLSGIAPLATHEGIRLCRPLLDTKRGTLRDHLSASGAAWTDDPSNDDPAHERVRIRRRLASGDLPSAASIARLAALSRRHRAWLDARTAQALGACLRRDHEALRLALPCPAPTLARDILSTLAMAAGGVRYRPRLAVLEPVRRAWQDGARLQVAVGGALVASARGELHARREARAGATPAPLDPGAAFRRFRPASEDAIAAVLDGLSRSR